MTQQSSKRKYSKRAVKSAFAVSDRVRLDGQPGVILGLRPKGQVSVKFDSQGFAKVVDSAQLEKISG